MVWIEENEIALYFAVALLGVGFLFLFYFFTKKIYLSNRFFFALGAAIAFMALGLITEVLLYVGQGILLVLASVVLLEYVLLVAASRRYSVKRDIPKVFSLGEENNVQLLVENKSLQYLKVALIDELPLEFQKRDFLLRLSVKPRKEKIVNYQLRPVKRGNYRFEKINSYLSTLLGLVEYRHIEDATKEVPVYPSLIQMKKFELQAFRSISTDTGGVKKMRRIGHSYEFEQIKEYVKGDDYRSINWKATSRANRLMVNQYEDERAQQIYCIIDKSRTMLMPFEELSLLDYAINTSLVISNIALQKYDRAGLITFSDTIGATLKAERKANQLNKILQALYREKERKQEANFELLYRATRSLIQGRSLIFLFTNFESRFALERVLPLLRRINKQHLLVVVFFENTEISAYLQKEAKDTKGIYNNAIARQYTLEKQQIVNTLKQLGIQAILTPPEELSLNAVNKYLELKSRGLI